MPANCLPTETTRPSEKEPSEIGRRLKRVGWLAGWLANLVHLLMNFHASLISPRSRLPAESRRPSGLAGAVLGAAALASASASASASTWPGEQRPGQVCIDKVSILANLVSKRALVSRDGRLFWPQPLCRVARAQKEAPKMGRSRSFGIPNSRLPRVETRAGVSSL